MVSYRHPAGWGLCIPAPSIWCLLSSHWLVCRSTHLIGWHSFFHPLVKHCYWWTQSWNAAALETTVDDAVGWQGKGLGIAGDQKRGFWARWDPENGLFLVQHNFKVDKAKTKIVDHKLFLWQPQSSIPDHWFPGVLAMATKEDPAVNGHPGDDSTGRQQGSEGRGNKGDQGPGRGKNESNAQNRPKSEPNCCLLENGKRCTRPASNASYRWHSCINTKSKTNHTL